MIGWAAGIAGWVTAASWAGAGCHPCGTGGVPANGTYVVVRASDPDVVGAEAQVSEGPYGWDLVVSYVSGGSDVQVDYVWPF